LGRACAEKHPLWLGAPCLGAASLASVPQAIAIFRPALLLFTLFAAAPGSALSRQSIVGTWATPGRCGVPLSTVVVEPMRFSGEDFNCDFDVVSRQGDTVRWQGRCRFGVDKPGQTRVTARLRGARLAYRIGKDGWSGPLERCPKSS